MEGEDGVTQDITPADLDWAAGMGGVTPQEAVALGRTEMVKDRWGCPPQNLVSCVTVFHSGNNT